MMKFRISTGFLLILFLWGQAPGQVTLKNLVPNPSFEYTGEDVVRERPDQSWTFGSSGPDVTGHATSSRSVDGFRSYLIRAEAGTGYLESDPFELDRRNQYLLSFGICGDGDIQSEILWWRKQNDELILLSNDTFRTISASDEWTVPENRVTPPRRAHAASVRFTVSAGSVWIDDVRFR